MINYFCQAGMEAVQNVPLFCPAERPFFVFPSDSEASLTSFGTRLRDVIPRHASAEGPPPCASGWHRILRNDIWDASAGIENK